MACDAADRSDATCLEDMEVRFSSPSGDLPLLSISTMALTHSNASVAAHVVQTTQGTKEDAVCNNRGRCGAFVSSGRRGDDRHLLSTTRCAPQTKTQAHASARCITPAATHWATSVSKTIVALSTPS